MSERTVTVILRADVKSFTEAIELLHNTWHERIEAMARRFRMSKHHRDYRVRVLARARRRRNR